MPTLNWIGKEAVVNYYPNIPIRTMEQKYTFPTDSASDNMIIHGDNLLALKALLPLYEGRIKCIYIDPPYNTGNEGWVYNDNVNSTQINEWFGQVVGKEAEDITRHDKWLCMMYPRLKLMKKLLSDNGAIFISIDDNEHAYLKLICDEIFGEENFVGNVVWQKKFIPHNDSEWFSDIIVCYAKNKIIWYPNLLERVKSLYSKTNGAPNDTSPLSIWIQEIGRVPSAKYELKAIFHEVDRPFDTPKPSALIEHILQIASEKNDIILDSFAGSGTTAHAVLNYNKRDGGNRRFILVEMEDYAETITAERVRRVIKGYGKDENAVKGKNGDFSYYELGN